MDSSDPLVDFFILLGNNPVFVTPRLDDRLITLFKDLRKDQDADLPQNIKWNDCTFYRLKNPVAVDLPGGPDSGNLKDMPNEVKEACLEESNKLAVNPMRTKVRQLADTLSNDFFYLVIELPNPFQESSDAISRLQQNHAILFQCLYVTVKSLGDWCKEDVQNNLQGGISTENSDLLPDEFREIQNALAQKRVYKVTDDINQQRDFQNARSYQRQFNRVFTATSSETRTVQSNREFATFYNLLRCFDEDVGLGLIARKETSSSLKTSNFTVYFIQPPFFSEINDNSRGFRFQQEKGWGFSMFVGTTPNASRKFSPRSDWAITSPEFTIPFVISEVISLKTEKNRFRMLVQAIALARAGQFLMRAGSQKRFFVIAIYVNADMIASRYIVMQTGDSMQDNRPVTIHQKDFDLRQLDDEVDFLREMYNLATQISVLSGELDGQKKGSLREIHLAASKVLSLSRTKLQQKTPGNTTMDIIPEEASERGELEDEDDLGVFEDEDIQSILRQMNYRVEYIPFGHPQLAVIVSETGENRRGYLKFTERQNEVDVLQYLAAIDSPSNHTVSGVRFWSVQAGTVISMPVAGGWLTSLTNPTEKLWSVALQLIEAVAFMHEHNVAHMDLKPQNVIIPLEGGRLSIIDFSVSIRVRTPNTRYNGVVGTDDYIAPEVREGLYKPMLTDLWSCGRTLEELCACCRPSVDRTTLLEMANQLMNRDPKARPTMSCILERMATIHRGGEGNVVPPMVTALPTVSISPLCVDGLPFERWRNVSLGSIF